MMKRLWLTLAGAYALPVSLALFIAWLSLCLWANSNRYAHADSVLLPLLTITSSNVLTIILVAAPLFGGALLVLRLFRRARVLPKVVAIGIFLVILLVAFFAYVFTVFGGHHIEGVVTVSDKTYALLSEPSSGFQCHPVCTPPNLWVIECSGLGLCMQRWELPEAEAMYAHFSASQFVLSYDAAQSALIVDIPEGYFDGFSIPISEQRN